jgi:arylsulfatase A-like enzyme
MAVKKNILLITTDQQRWDTLGSYGCQCIRTPALDALAARGVRYERCYVNNPVCTPSRASLLTGKSIIGHGVHRVYSNFPTDEIPVSYRLQQEGYQTALIGKLHISSRTFELASRHHNDGFEVYEYSIAPHSPPGAYNAYADWLKRQHPAFHDEFMAKGRMYGNVPEACHFTHWAAERSIAFIRNRDRTRPFFCFMSIADPHDPYNDHPASSEALVDQSLLPPRLRRDGELALQPEPSRRANAHSSAGRYDEYSPDDFRRMRLGYFASIAFADQEIGRVLQALRDAGLDESTQVVFTSDHGDMLGDHDQLIKGPFFYDASVRVPLIIADPDLPQRSAVAGNIVQLHDLAATMLGAAGWTQQRLQEIMPEAQDLVALQRGCWSGGFRDMAITAFRSTMIDETRQYYQPPIHATMLREGDYKLNVFHSSPGSGFAVEGQLFDMARDPEEQTDLWNEQALADVRNRLCLRLMDWLVHNEVWYYGNRGGEVIPPSSQRSLNNLL